ncbi:MAG: PD-(D/E)XK nuclease family protein, partial [Nitriliruptorales bacterium]
SWYRTSYSRLTVLAHEPRIRSETAEPLKDDEHLPAGVAGSAGADEDADLRSVPLPLGDLPAGTAFGTFVHAVLEETAFDAGDLDDELALRVGEQLAHFPIDGVDREVLVGGLRRVLETPLGPLAGETCLAGVPQAARLDELGFELPLAGGDTPTGGVTLAGIGRLLEVHLDPDDPVAAYAERLAEPALQQTARGYLTGSIDLVLRVGDDGDPRFLVVDHKTNRLAPPDEELTAWHYRRAALNEAMAAGHYHLQALLYTVALHRFLRWRLREPAYEPDRHLGGVLYLFLRGMTGADVPRSGGQPCGVFSWRPPTELVVALSDLLDQGEAR